MLFLLCSRDAASVSIVLIILKMFFFVCTTTAGVSMSVAPEEIRDVTSLTTVHDRRAEDGSNQRSTDSRNGISLGVILFRSMS